jgi:hypothetical protein
MIARSQPEVFEERPTVVPLRRTALVAMTALAAGVGLLPYAIFLGKMRPLIMFGALIVALPVAAWQLRGWSSQATEQPSTGEMILGAWSSVPYAAAVSLWGIFFYGLARGVLWLVGKVALLWGVELHLATERWAVWTSLGAAALVLVPVLGVATNDLVRLLYPTTAGARSPFFALLAERRRLRFMLLWSLVAVVALGTALWNLPSLLAVAAGICLLYSGASLETLGRAGTENGGRHPTLACLDRLLQAAGYETVLSPRSGHASLDPLLTTVDLLVRAPGQVWVMEIKARKPGKGAVEWYEASRLRNAALAMREVLTTNQPEVDVEPLLVLVGRPRGDSLGPFLQREPMRVVDLDEAELTALAAVPEESQVRALTARLGLEYLATGKTAASPAEDR